MKLLRVIPLLALAAATAAPSSFAGGDAPPPLPSVVDVPLTAAKQEMKIARREAAAGNSAKAVTALTSTRSYMSQAWSGAKYLIETTPPPAAVSYFRRIAPVSGGGTTVSTFADQYQSAFAVLTLQHFVATRAVGMLPTASGTVLPGVSSTLFAALNNRDAALKYIAAIPAPPATTSGVVGAHASGTAATDSFATVMPGLAPLIADEVQQLQALQVTAKFSSGRGRVAASALAQDLRAEGVVNTTWPPVITEE